MKRHLYLNTFVATLGGLLFGFDTAVINGALPFMRNYFVFTDVAEGLAMSSALIGCIFGALFVGRPGDRYGRKAVLKFLALLFLISALGTGLADNLTIFIIFRFIGGLAVGGASVMSPMYISEIAPPAQRGRLVATSQLAIVLGVLFAFFSNYLISIADVGANNWRWMFLAEALPAVAFFILLFFVSRSPRWLVEAGKIQEAEKVIREVNPGEDARKVLNDIIESIDQNAVKSMKVLFRKPYFKLVVIGFLVGMFNQFTGINIIMYYSSDIFVKAGFSTDSALLQTLVIGFTNLIFTLIAMAVIDKFGRKVLLYIGAVGMTVFLGLFAGAFLTGNTKSYNLVFYLMGYISFFAFSQGAVIWVILSEMFPNNIRARASSIGSFSHWMWNSIIAFLFPVVSSAFGTGPVFVFFAVATFIGLFFYIFVLVETKGKSLEELEKILLKK